MAVMMSRTLVLVLVAACGGAGPSDRPVDAPGSTTDASTAQEAHLDVASARVGEGRGDLAVGVRVHRDVDRVARGADPLGHLLGVRGRGRLRREDDVDLRRGNDAAGVARVVEELVERGRSDVRDGVELGERVERATRALAVGDDVARDARREAGRMVQLVQRHVAVIDQRQDTARLGRPVGDAAVRLPVPGA